MATREILTLQFGHYSNFVGSHFWNIQELSFDYTGLEKTEVNHDVLYREGRNRSGQVTYTPRLLLADLKGSTKTLPVSGGLYEDVLDEPDPLWPSVEKIEEQKPKKNKYLEDIDTGPSTSTLQDYNLESEVDTWTDYLYPRFHERSVNIVNEYQHGDESNSFNTYPAGVNVWKSQDFGENFSNNIRKYVEECDHMQGFQVNFDAVDGFAGLALGCIEHLVDEYAKTILATPIIPSFFTDNKPSTEDEKDKSNTKDSIRLINYMLSIRALSEHASLFIPVCTSENGWRKPGRSRRFEYLNYNSEIYYHSSAILAAANDTLSHRIRLKSNDYALPDLCADMTGYGRKMAAFSLGLPFAMVESDYLIDHLNNLSKPLTTTITPGCKLGADKLVQLFTLRGISETRLKLPSKEAKKQLELAAYRCENIKEMMELYFQSTNYLSLSNVTVCEKPLKIQTPFPSIFSKDLSKFGFVKAVERSENVQSTPIIAGCHNGTFMADCIEKIHRDTTRIKFAKMHMFGDNGLEEAEYKECLDQLEEFKENYEDYYDL